MTLPQSETILGGQFIVQPTTVTDLEDVLKLFQTFQLEHLGDSNFSLDNLRSSWATPGLTLENNMRSIFTPARKLVAYVEVWDTSDVPVRPTVWGYVHPDYRGHGIGSYLVQWGEQRARQVITKVPEEARVVMVMSRPSRDVVAKKLFEAHGLFVHRSHLDMVIELEKVPDVPAFPEGITITTLAERPDIKALFEVVYETFQDHRDHVEGTFESKFADFRNEVENDPLHDPTLWFLALDGDTIAATSLCRLESWDRTDEGCVTIFGVRRPYRRKGLGLALLRYSFNQLWQRGQHRVILGVDGSNLSGATRLYERAGMHPHVEFIIYEKELRPGVEISKQS